ncbi:Protein phosphatase 1 regulatory subunit 16A [Fasciola gigantica]|uniref:Protein phosphatase 1 regulatory subunit 16A n=1 Tax=Fasciola gigantica TaxID=46835 RepID=A0A504YSL2_FASGI|nr:Protein phosphatase 1 regulatory subunit 16A [Fasciola gigantica]
MTDILARPRSIPLNNVGLNSMVPQGRIDVRRLEAARSNRQLQLEEWEEYDRKMRSLDKKKQHSKQESKSKRVIFQKQYVLLDATLNNDIDEGQPVILEVILIYRTEFRFEPGQLE